jgi:hypothetical protein
MRSPLPEGAPCCSRSCTSSSAVSSEPEVAYRIRRTSSSWCSGTQVKVLQRQVKRPRLHRLDRVLLAAASDWTLILGRRHLDRVLRSYADHYNTQRPHRGLGLRAPAWDPSRSCRRFRGAGEGRRDSRPPPPVEGPSPKGWSTTASPVGPRLARRGEQGTSEGPMDLVLCHTADGPSLAPRAGPKEVDLRPCRSTGPAAA